MKRIVLCCDGTWNRAEQGSPTDPTPTNVVRTGYLVAKAAAGKPQIICYDQGVGTGNTLDRLSGGAFGYGLDENIFEAYRFLIANYEPGDELFLFGFSRGAFTVRSIVGMIRKCGILRRSSVKQYRAAVTLYRNNQHPDDDGPDGPKAFRSAHSVSGESGIPVKFIGVWDTVGALGIPLRGLKGLTRRKYQFHDTELSGIVQHAYQALAIDEHRAPFEPTLWRYKPKPDQIVEQVWFCGVHSDIGGGYADRGLSDITLKWMIDKAKSAGLGLDREALGAYPLQPDARGRLHDSMTAFYRLPGLGMDRPIGVVAKAKAAREAALDPTQSVHETVRQRWDADPKYRPAALRAYFKRIKDPRAEGTG